MHDFPLQPARRDSLRKTSVNYRETRETYQQKSILMRSSNINHYQLTPMGENISRELRKKAMQKESAFGN